MPLMRIGAAAPDEAPPQRIKTVEIIICCFSLIGCEPDWFLLVSTKQFFSSFRIL